jgi:peptide/nickel transport system permease protein
MWRFIVKRCLIAIPVLFVITLLDFLFISLAPGDPLQAVLPQDDASNSTAIDQQYEDSGLNDPLPVQYVRWLGQVGKGQFGESFRTGKPAADAIAKALPNTLRLTLSAAAIALLIGIPLGILAALRERTWIDEILTLFSFIVTSIPSFFLALIAVFVFAVRYNWFPATGAQSFDKKGDLTDTIHHLLLPALVLGILQAPAYIRHLRGAMLETLQEEYVRTARSKGLSERVVIIRHVLRNAMMPVLTLIGLQIPGLVGSSLLVEQVFGWPGLGTLSIQSALFRDYPVFMGTALLYAVAVVAGSLITDLLYGIANPRVRYA